MKGKYDDLSEGLMRVTGAKAVLLLVIEGHRGDGFSVSVQAEHHPEIVAKVPTVLRYMANDIQAESEHLKNQ